MAVIDTPAGSRSAPAGAGGWSDAASTTDGRARPGAAGQGHGAGPTEHLDVVVVGAGLSGIGAAHHLQAECPWATFTILEARDAIGGTWDLFRYPGIRSDSDMYTLGYGFRPWTGEKTIADGADIRRYIEETARDEGIDRRIRFRHRVVAADWSSSDGRWTLTIERGDTGTVEQITCGFLFSCTGYYRYDQGYLPDFPDMDRFGGTLVHPQAWPEDLDVRGRRVVVIGSGATAVTLVPALADLGAQVTMLQRSPSYIATVPNPSPVARLVRRLVPGPAGAVVVKWAHALITQGSYALSRRYPKVMRRALVAGVRRQLPPGFDVATHFTPHYDPWDQRLCAVPNGDLFRAIRSGAATVVTDHIDRFTETGIRLRSGTELTADIVVTATGLELLFLGGMTLTVDGVPVDLPSRMVYKGMMLQDVPNLAFAVGYTNASWTLKCDLTCSYTCRLLQHMRRTGTSICTPIDTSGDVSPEPLLGLTSGYVLRSVDRFPKQGVHYPWKVYQSYLRDLRALRRSDVDDGVVRFTNPERGRRVAPEHVATDHAGALAPGEPPTADRSGTAAPHPDRLEAAPSHADRSEAAVG